MVGAALQYPALTVDGNNGIGNPVGLHNDECAGLAGLRSRDFLNDHSHALLAERRLHRRHAQANWAVVGNIINEAPHKRVEITCF